MELRRACAAVGVGAALTFGLLASGAAGAPTGSPAATVSPPSAPAGSTVTVTGSGFGPGESVTASLGGSTIGTAFADDLGNVSIIGPISATIPAGSHPLDLEGDQGGSVTIEYLVEAGSEPAPAEEQAPAPAGSEGGPAPGTPSEGVAPGETDTTPTTTPPDETTTTLQEPAEDGDSDDNGESSDDGGIPGWVWALIIGILVAAGLVAGMRFMPGGGTTARFTDTGGTSWDYCEARACKVKQRVEAHPRKVYVRAVARKGKCKNCTCVLFEIPKTGPKPKMLSDDGTEVRKKGGVAYSARCVKEA